ncbi:hypothetical protein GCM10023321_05340 [Pseudonocardia eucalypti]|uniref:NlpC/P60 domain-containing protein n=1 Tax=Pseudonocardia eucalypti TaxID=648755 RepID=A0ABP9PGR8_9PSEU|nr:cell wall-associated NlpC family hydrolase [Pseudonocardia eucalypti]
MGRAGQRGVAGYAEYRPRREGPAGKIAAGGAICTAVTVCVLVSTGVLAPSEPSVHAAPGPVPRPGSGPVEPSGAEAWESGTPAHRPAAAREAAPHGADAAAPGALGPDGTAPGLAAPDAQAPDDPGPEARPPDAAAPDGTAPEAAAPDAAAPDPALTPVEEATGACTREVSNPADLRAAILTGNPEEVVCLRGTAARPAADVALAFAHEQLGTPYVWGGNGPDDGGFDCSGLVMKAYASAGVRLPRTAQAQFEAGPRIPEEEPIRAGDLVFFGGGPKSVTHVGVAVSATRMIDAPQRGEVVKVGPIKRANLVGITRPAGRALG